MATASVSGTAKVGSVQIMMNVNRVGAGDEAHEPQMPAGIAGTLTTRTSDVAGVITVAAGLGAQFATGDILAVFFTSAAGAPSVVYGKYATVDGDAITIEDDTGANYVGESPDDAVLPAQNSAVVICKKTVSNCQVARGDVLYAIAGCDYPAVGIFGGAAAIWTTHIAVGGSPIVWDKAAGGGSPLTADPTMLVCYNGGTAEVKFQYGFILAT